MDRQHKGARWARVVRAALAWSVALGVPVACAKAPPQASSVQVLASGVAPIAAATSAEAASPTLAVAPSPSTTPTTVPTTEPDAATPTVVAPTATPAPLPSMTTSPVPSTSTPSPTVQPAPSPVAPSLTPWSAPVDAVTRVSANLRAGPGESYGVVQVLSAGEGLTILGKVASGQWWQVRVPSGPSGWVSATLVALKVPESTVRVVPAPAAPTPPGSPRVAAAPPSSAASPAARTATPAATASSSPVRVGRVTAIGDSVMLDAATDLEHDVSGIQVNAAVSRQVAAGISILSQARAAGQLGTVVVIHLGTNGTFTTGQFDQIMQILTAERRVVFVNIRVDRSWEGSDNAVLAAGVQRYASTRLVDWHDASAGHVGYFWNDGIHLRPEGAAVYASLIASAVAAP